MALAVGILVLAEGRVIEVPWLTGTNRVNFGTVAAFIYSCAAILMFRNEISRLEFLTPRRWCAIDRLILLVLWVFPWGLALTGIASSRFAYVSTVLIGLCICAGRFFRVDTLALLFVAQLVVQTGLWPVLEYSPLRHALFLLDHVRLLVMLAVSGMFFILACTQIDSFKKKT